VVVKVDDVVDVDAVVVVVVLEVVVMVEVDNDSVWTIRQHGGPSFPISG
jgi:hypothetical protein